MTTPFLDELVECAKTELGKDVVIGEVDTSLTFEKLFGYLMVEASTDKEASK